VQPTIPKKPRKSVPPACTTPPKFLVTKQGRLKCALDTRPRFGIFAYGCFGIVYKGIRHEQRETYQYLLASRDFLAEHPTAAHGALEAVGRMKPF
jgi:hypothetical protein